MTFGNQILVHPDFIDVQSEIALLADVIRSLDQSRLRSGNGRSRILRFGWSYEADEYMGDAPMWIPHLPEINSWTINEYPLGHAITPHVDSLKFGDTIHILSLNTHTGMVFTSPDGVEKVVELPPRSLLSMRGEVRNKWKHATLPTSEGVRYSIVYRRKV